MSVCVQPLDVVRTRLQADAAKGISRSTVGAFRVLVQEQGVRYNLLYVAGLNDMKFTGTQVKLQEMLFPGACGEARHQLSLA